MLSAVLAAAEPRPAPPPQRIASLNLAADEILVELVSTDRLVCATTFADDPGLSNIVGRIPESLPRVVHAQLERLVALRPDLVVVSEFTDADFMHLLSASGIRHHRLSGLGSLAGISQGIRALGEAVGEKEKARALVERFESSLREIDRRVKGVPRPRVLFWNDPDAFGTGTLMHDLVERAGGRSVAAEMGIAGVRPIGAERALAADPDVFAVAKGDRATLLAHPVLSKARAVREGRIVEIPGPLHTTLTHHAARAAEFLAEALHPGLGRGTETAR